MLQSILILNLFIVVMRFYKLAFSDPKPTFKKEFVDYINHIVGAHFIFLMIMFLIYLFS